MNIMNRFCVSACAAIAVGAATVDISSAQFAPSRYRPVWQVGDQWTVQTTSQQLQIDKPKSIQLDWQFGVQKIEQLGGRPCYRVLIRPADKKGPNTFMWVDKNSMTIQKVQTQIPTPYGYQPMTQNYQQVAQGAPVIGPMSVLPLDLPRFPLQGQKSLGEETFEYEVIDGPARACKTIPISPGIRIRQLPKIANWFTRSP